MIIVSLQIFLASGNSRSIFLVSVSVKKAV